jgi:hypothetical protein
MEMNRRALELPTEGALSWEEVGRMLDHSSLWYRPKGTVLTLARYCLPY